jgi:hypothetical protein
MTNITATLAKLEALTTAPKVWAASITLRDGSTRKYEAATRQLASAWCDRYLSRDDSHEIVDCSVTRIAA